MNWFIAFGRAHGIRSKGAGNKWADERNNTMASNVVTILPPRQLALLDIKRSGLTEKDYKQLKLKALTAQETFEITDKFKHPSLMFPYLDSKGRETDFFRLRFMDDGRRHGTMRQRYWQAPDTAPRLYLPAGVDWLSVFADVSVPLLITEGEKKAAAYVSKTGVPCCGLGGVWSWKSAKQKLPIINDFLEMSLKGREVRLCFDTDALPKPEVDGALAMLAAALEQRGAKCSRIILPLLPKHDKTGLDDFLVARGVAKFEKIQPVSLAMSEELVRLNVELAVIIDPPGVFHLPSGRLITNPQTLTNLLYADQRTVRTDAQGRLVECSAAAEWLKWPHRRQHKAVAFEPGLPKILEGDLLNLWDPLPIEPKKGDLSLFEELLDGVFGRDENELREWFLRWVAYPIQHPGAKMYSACVLWSKATGTGKTLVGQTIGKMYGPYFGVATEAILHGAFNGWQARKQFILGEEVTGSDRRSEADKLKHMITGEVVNVNQKFQAPYDIRNCVNYLFTTNHPDAFLLDDEDRRYFIHELRQPKPSRKFFAAYDRWYRTPEAAAALLYYFLEDVSLGSFSATDKALATAARDDMVSLSGTEADVVVRELLESPEAFLRIGETGVIARDLFTIGELLDLVDPGQRKLSRISLGKALRRAGRHELPMTKTTKGVFRLWAVRNHEKWAKAEHSVRAREYDGSS